MLFKNFEILGMRNIQKEMYKQGYYRKSVICIVQFRQMDNLSEYFQILYCWTQICYFGSNENLQINMIVFTIGSVIKYLQKLLSVETPVCKLFYWSYFLKLS